MKIKPLLVAATLSVASLSIPTAVIADTVYTSFTDGTNLVIEATFPEIATVVSNSSRSFRIPMTIRINGDISNNTTLTYADVKLKVFVATAQELVAEDWIFKLILDPSDRVPTSGDWGSANISDRFDFNGKLKSGDTFNVNAWIRRSQVRSPTQVVGYLAFFPSLSFVKTETVIDNDTGVGAAAGTNPNRFTILTSDRPTPPTK